MKTLLFVIHVFVAFLLIGLVLIQRGKGAEMGAAFGSGASQTVFGSQGSASFLTRLSAVFATLFFITSLALGYVSAQGGKGASSEVIPGVPTVSVPSPSPVPAAPTDVPSFPKAPDSGAGSGGSSE